MRSLVAGSLLLFCLPAVAQNWEEADSLRMNRDKFIEQKIEQIAESSENEDLDYSALIDQLNFYLDFPLNLNTADAENLAQIVLLSSYQVSQFLEYRDKYGEILSPYELPLINGWDVETAQTILPFVSLEPNPEQDKLTLNKLRKYGRNELLIRWQRIIEDQEGFLPIEPTELADNPNARYLGSPDKLYARYRYRYSNRLSFGVTAEKDAGEVFWNDSVNKGFDFYSAHVYLSDLGPVKSLALGDYQAQFGQGLTFWSGLSFNRKGAFTLSTAQVAPGISPYTSVNENLFLRGIATTVSLWKLDVSVFYSGKKIDANVLDNTGEDSLTIESNTLSVSSFQETGFHRTPGELADKNAIFQEHYGANVAYKQRDLAVGFTAARMEIDAEFNRSSQPYSQFRSSANSNSVMGVDYQYQLRNFFFYGETSRSENGNMATLNGLNVALDPRLSLNILQRYYSPYFQGVASTGFGEGSQVENEAGVYLGAELRVFKRVKINTYFDQFRFPWLRYRVDAPSRGHDFFVQAEFQVNSRTNLYARYRSRNKLINTSMDVQGIRNVVENPRQTFRLNLSHKVNSQFKLRSRLELTAVAVGSEPTEHGYMIYQDLIYAPHFAPFSLSLRYALFDTDSYDARIYAYENDVLYAWSIPAYSGRGSRFYSVLKYKISRDLDIWLRYGQFYYTDRNIIGTGKDEISGRTKSEVKVQLKYTF